MRTDAEPTWRDRYAHSTLHRPARLLWLVPVVLLIGGAAVMAQLVLLLDRDPLDAAVSAALSASGGLIGGLAAVWLLRPPASSPIRRLDVAEYAQVRRVLSRMSWRRGTMTLPTSLREVAVDEAHRQARVLRRWTSVPLFVLIGFFVFATVLAAIMSDPLGVALFAAVALLALGLGVLGHRSLRRLRRAETIILAEDPSP